MKDRVKKEPTDLISAWNSYLLLVGLALLVFFNVLFNDFVFLDNTYIVNNPVIAHFDFMKIIQNESNTSGGFFRPLTALYFGVVYTIGLHEAFLFHLLQVIFRVIVGCLLFSIFSTFFKRTVALFLAAVYTVHPINYSTTAYISNSADALYMLIGIVASYLVVKNIWTERKRFLILIILFLGLLAKESGVLFFGFILLYIFLFRRKEFTFYFWGELITLLLYLGLRYVSNGFPPTDNSLIPITQLPLMERLLSVPQIIYYYLKNSFLPLYLGINNLWYVKAMTWKEFYLPLLYILFFMGSLVSLGFYCLKTSKTLFKKYLFFSIIFAGGLSAYLQIIPLDYTVAGRWFVFPMIGLLGILGIVLELTTRSSKKLFAVFAIVVILYAARSVYTSNVFDNNLSFFTYATDSTPNFFNHYALARTLYGEKQYDQALIQIKKSQNLLDYDLSYALEGNIHRKLGDEKKAVVAYKTSLEFHDKESHAYESILYLELIKYLLREEKYMKAEKLLYEALPRNMRDEQMWILFAYTEYHLKQTKQAIAALKEAYTISPHDPTLFQMHNAIKEHEQFPEEITERLLK